ncbi:MAG TPA: OB-fold domain-containing protein, partial [Chloroflexota bacterium]|nr:OB-fold domain-containing protein [Chloroflexota bacterium]
TIFHRAYHKGFTDELPYAVAVVELEEGPRLVSNIVGCSPNDVNIGMPVSVVFEDVTEDTTLFKFQPR